MRVHGTQGPFPFTLLRRGDDYAYKLMSFSGERLLRISHIHGKSVAYDHSGNVNANADAFAVDLNGIIEVFTNDLATRPAHQASNGEAVVIDVGMDRSATILVGPNGVCISAMINGWKKRTMVPERLSDIPKSRKSFSGWRSNGDLWMVEDVLPNNPISDDELGAQ